MSLILRHKPETIGISLDEHGWVDVDELIMGIARLMNSIWIFWKKSFTQIINRDIRLMKIKH